ncbi:heterokaryon incompatibility protein-domain-containing protein [Paraphoma chrysanthemicola]|nr:heterokaryon incompatibility protein-domain-containing protein [Paraphoma chrysanthemicola]
MAVSNCEVCKDLQDDCHINCTLDELERTTQAGCNACRLLHAVVTSHHPGVEDIEIYRYVDAKGEFDLRVQTFDTSSRLPKILSQYLEVEIISDEADSSIPWTVIPHRPSNIGVESPSVAATQLKQWLETCETHRTCRDSSLQELAYLRTRVLELQDSDIVRLHVSKNEDRGLYACLSHCWGGVVPLRTTSDNLYCFQHTGMPWHSLPKTFQHAIDLVRRLGVRYLWIDSLCIVQDDLQDWRHEGSRMSEIYSGAYFTIAASNAQSSEAGLYQDLTEHKRPKGTKSHVFPHPNQSGSFYEVLSFERLAPNFFMEAKFAGNELPLQQRAWAFQERLLSPRTLHFADNMLHWECLSASMNEFNMSDLVPTDAIDFRLPTSSPTSKHSGAQVQTSMQAIKMWHRIVSCFTSCELTYQKDKLPALQGVARRLQDERSSAYFAGLWEDSIWYDALWYVLEPERATSSGYRAPSWSWASREGEVHYVPNKFLAPTATVVNVATIPAGDDPMGEILDGLLTIRGPCLPAILEHKSSDVTELIVRDSIGEKKRLEWHRDSQDQNTGDCRATILVLATSHAGFEVHMLVLAHSTNDDAFFARIGQARLNFSNWTHSIHWEEGEFTIV